MSDDSNHIKMQQLEKLILNISFYSGILFLIVEIIMAIITKSQAVLMDSIFDMVELIVIAIAIFLVPILHKPITEKNPYGFSQVESLFIVFKGFMLIAVTSGFIINNIQIILSGGASINNFSVAIFQLILAIISLLILLSMKLLSKKVPSPTIEMEIYGWKIDALCSFAIFIAFLIPEVFKGAFFENLTPYLDQIVVIIVVIVVIPEPIKIFFTAFKDIFLFAPEDDIMNDIKTSTTNILEKYGFSPTFFDVTRTGRKLWVEIYFTTDKPNIEMYIMKNAKFDIDNVLSENYPYIHLELIPDI